MHPRRVARDPGDRARQAAVQAYLDQHGPGAPDKGPRDECGVFGIYGHPDAAQVTFSGLLALQHRGQESAGIVSSDGIRHYVHKGMGLVGDVFGSEEQMARLRGSAAIGHVRYSTTGSSTIGNAQPLVVSNRHVDLAIAHNGNLVDAHVIRDQLEDQGAIFQTTVDTEVLAHLILRRRGRPLEQAIADSLKEVHGAYALTILSEDRLIGVRDPHGIRPLVLGRLGDAWVLASETCAFDVIGADFIREIAPGELVVITSTGLRSMQAVPAGEPHLCVFEFIYFARPDSNFEGLNVHAMRKAMGKQLAREAPCACDIVVGVPDSSVSAASGYAEELGVPFEMGLVKNRYIGRTFIQPNQSMRMTGVRNKLNPLRKVVEGKRVCLVDDSIVRGTTSRQIVAMLREAGAREVHMRIASPPYRNPCNYGIDTSVREELVATGRDIPSIEQYIGPDSLSYLSEEGMLKAVAPGAPTHCTACFTGEYAVPIDEHAGKFILERDLK